MTPMPLRFVIFSPKLGVYLGDGEWSYNYKGEKDSAPTFDSEDESTKEEREKAYTDGIVCSQQQVHPDRPDNRASQEACANAFMPRWGKQK